MCRNKFTKLTTPVWCILGLSGYQINEEICHIMSSFIFVVVFYRELFFRLKISTSRTSRDATVVDLITSSDCGLYRRGGEREPCATPRPPPLDMPRGVVIILSLATTSQLLLYKCYSWNYLCDGKDLGTWSTPLICTGCPNKHTTWETN